MRLKKLAILVIILLNVFLISAYGLFQLSKSRTFQFFGGLVDRVETNEKVIALTFDDAPTEYVKDVLQILDEKNVKATFFVIGQQIEKYPDTTKEIVQKGHELGNHSYSHKRMVLKWPKFIDDEIKKTNKLIKDSGYSGEIHFRPPNGKKLFFLPWYLANHNMKTIMWDVEPDTYGDSEEFLINYVVENSNPGSIILMHPFCQSCQNDRNALGKIIDKLQSKGYQFVTISELLK